MKTFMIAGLLCLPLAACAGDGKKDYVASAHCYDMGYKAGTDAYDQCIKEEKSSRMLKEQRQEFERMKQDQEDWKQRRY